EGHLRQADDRAGADPRRARTARPDPYSVPGVAGWGGHGERGSGRGRGERERGALHRVRAARGKNHGRADPNGAHRSGLHGGDGRAVGEGHRDRAVEHGGAVAMLLGEIVRVALEALRANKLRSLLTMLGIIIGVGAVITMIALGSGAQKAVQDRIQALGPTLLSIYPGQSFMRDVASGNRVSLTMDDGTALANNARYLSAVVPELSSNLQVQKADQNINVTVMGTTPTYATVHNYTVTAGRMFTAGHDAARRRVMRRQHKVRPGQDNDFQIRNQTDILATLQQTTDTFKYLLAGIAAVSLLVGGIGIKNIMLVSVTERTREIGVRKALGATRFNILFQFLVEALVLCLLGGMIGVVLGSGGAIVLSRIAHWNTLISPLAILLAFVFSAAVGLFFGIWPARRAAALDPIAALRSE